MTDRNGVRKSPRRTCCAPERRLPEGRTKPAPFPKTGKGCGTRVLPAHKGRSTRQAGGKNRADKNLHRPACGRQASGARTELSEIGAWRESEEASRCRKAGGLKSAPTWDDRAGAKGEECRSGWRPRHRQRAHDALQKRRARYGSATLTTSIVPLHGNGSKPVPHLRREPCCPSMARRRRGC